MIHYDSSKPRQRPQKMLRGGRVGSKLIGSRVLKNPKTVKRLKLTLTSPVSESVERNKLTNETLKTIYERRAVRKFKSQPVDIKLIDKIVDAGRMAPSALNRQLWKFYVLTDKKLINSLSPAVVKVANKFLNWAHGMDLSRVVDIIFHNAPVVIFITSPKKNEWAAIDVGMCSQNIMLAAKSLGLDTCPIGLAKYLHRPEAVLGMSSKEEIKLAIVVGYGDERPKIHERKQDNLKYVKA